MSHLDEGQLLTLRDETAAPEDGTLRHLESCPGCRDALDASRAQALAVAGALGALDAAPWDLEGAREKVRLRVSNHAAAAAWAVSLPARRPRLAAWSLSRAAGLVLLAAAGASALPGSPVRSWMERWVAPPAEEAVTPASAPITEPAAAAVEAEEAGVRLPVSGSGLSLVLRGAAPETEIRVTWIAASEAALFAPVGSRFTSAAGRVEALLVPGTVRVELPRGAVPVSLEVNGRILLRNTPAGLEVSGPVVERTDAGITFRVPPR
ncbi:MAG: hypothetical protein Q8N53_17120 [Longimicrobiales bacterium]|nr:hypothetical protein [Longimicrobiales bacterium]